VDEVLREAGMEYAKLLPGALALVVGLLVLFGWLAYKAHEEGSPGLAVFFAILAVAAVVQLPTAMASARAYCRTQIVSQSFGSVLYSDAKCRTAFPDGP
jgi:hypothetical protein